MPQDEKPTIQDITKTIKEAREIEKDMSSKLSQVHEKIEKLECLLPEKEIGDYTFSIKTNDGGTLILEVDCHEFEEADLQEIFSFLKPHFPNLKY